ncbi:hypothetical protein [Deinococcus peraridilitoris]|uniref:Uncharacterized protein n=1 Tax=Deinococcus peraridilitoris (strain DSM 19664 / LMG 22246 / CIP 109416 / KR-200) TaxID=937777 RepID=L0A4Z6_DEIPD|nr:hypothetical protein [Deinococcus peraridilitoris]AFZ68080.1 hypothetical protein Deipe_2615 [Deinococcus peraridilitoris DSM 19664]
MSIKTLLFKVAREILRQRGYGRNYGYIRGGKRKPRSLKGKIFDFAVRRIEKSLSRSRRR